MSTITKLNPKSIPDNSIGENNLTEELQTSLAEYATTTAMTLALAGKMDKVTDATSGNIAILDSAGEVKELSAGTEGQVLTQGGNGAEWASFDNNVTKTSVNAVKSSGIYSAIHPANQSSQPAGGMLPNVLYNLGTITGNVTMAMATPADTSVANHYFFTFDTSTTAPTITWDAKITSWKDGSAPTINASKHYEVSVLGGVAIIMEV